VRVLLPGLAASLIVVCSTAAADWRMHRTGLPWTFTIGLHAPATIEKDDYPLAAAAGFNLALPLRPGPGYCRALLRACGRAHIKAVAWDPRLATDNVGGWKLYKAGLAEYNKFNSLAGYAVTNYHVVPPGCLFNVFYRVRELGNADRRRFVYMQASPLGEFRSESSYENYLNRYLYTGIGYVLYEEAAPFSTEAMRAMQVVARVCSRRGSTWWRRCCIDKPSAPMIRWQAFAAAAAGAKGVIYLVLRPAGGRRTDALLGADGRPSPIYDAARATNRRITALSPTLMASRSSAFYTVGTMPENPTRPPRASPVASVISSIENDGFLVGVLRGRGRHIFIVRKPSDTTGAAQVTIKWAGQWKGTVVETGEPLEGPLTLLPGEGQLIRVKIRRDAPKPGE